MTLHRLYFDFIMKKTPLLIIISLLAILSIGANTKLYAQSPTSFDYISEWNNAQNQDKTNPTTIRLNLNRLLMEHATLATLHLQALYDGKDTGPTGNLLDQNANALADVFVSNTNVSSEEFLSIWREHIRQYERYTMALKQKDTMTMQDARTKLQDLSTQFGRLLNVHNRAITPDMLAQHMNKHVEGTLLIIDAHAEGNQNDEITRIKMGSDQAKEFADMMAAALANNR
jgi:hypothetical protein